MGSSLINRHTSALPSPILCNHQNLVFGDEECNWLNTGQFAMLSFFFPILYTLRVIYDESYPKATTF